MLPFTLAENGVYVATAGTCLLAVQDLKKPLKWLAVVGCSWSREEIVGYVRLEWLLKPSKHSQLQIVAR